MDGAAGVPAGTAVDVPPAPPADETAAADGGAAAAPAAEGGQETAVVQQEETAAPMETDALVSNETLEPSAPASSDLLG